MPELREVTLEERQRMMEDGVFDINGNIPAHPGYTGIHRHRDGTYWFRGQEVTDASDIKLIDNYVADQASKDEEGSHREGKVSLCWVPRLGRGMREVP